MHWHGVVHVGKKFIPMLDFKANYEIAIMRDYYVKTKKIHFKYNRFLRHSNF